MAYLKIIGVAGTILRHRIGIPIAKVPSIGIIAVGIRSTDVILIDQSVAIIVITFWTNAPEPESLKNGIIPNRNKTPAVRRQPEVTLWIFKLHIRELTVSVDILGLVFIVQSVSVIIFRPVRLPGIVFGIGL